MRVGISLDRDRPPALLERVRGRPRWPGGARRRGVHAEPYVVPAVQGRTRFTVAALDLGIEANTPRMMAERGIEVHVLPATSTIDDVLAVAPDGLFFSNGPGDPAATTDQVALLQGALDRGIPYFGICFGNQLFGRALGLRHLQAQVRPPRHQPAGDGPHDRQGRGDRAQPRLRGPWTCRSTRPPDAVRRGDGEPRVPQRRRGRGSRAARRRRRRSRRSRSSTTPRPPPAPTTRRTSSTGSCGLMDPGAGSTTTRGGHEAGCRSATTSRVRAGHRLRADHHRAGLRVRLLRHPGLPGAQGGGPPGRPGQLQPGDDHDRPGVRRRDVHRADHPGVRREGDRQGAARRAARHARRPDRAQQRDGPGRRRRPGEVRRGADRRLHRGDRPRREPRVLQADRRGARRRGGPLVDLPLDGGLPGGGRASSATRWWCARRSPWAAPAPAWPTTRTTCAASPAPASRPARPPRCSSRSRSSAGRSTSSR